MALLRDTAVQHRMGLLLARHLAAANLLGRAQVAREAERQTGKAVPIATTSRHHPRFAEDGSGQEDDSPAQDAPGIGVGFSFNLPPTNATNYLRNLTPLTKDIFDGLTAQYRRDAFTVAGVSDQRLIAKIRDELANAMAEGSTASTFKKAVNRITSDAGVERINAFTLDTVFTTNMLSAYSLGRYEQMTEPATMAVLPYWQYWTMDDDRVRPEHAAIHGFVARAVDPVWRKIYPPNGFNCRCHVVALLPREALAANKDADESGLLRLPLLAQLKVPQAGFGKVF